MTNLPDITSNDFHENCSNCHAGKMPCLGDLIFMEPEQRIEQYREWRTESGYSNIRIAEESGLSEVSISRFFAGQTKDTKVSTLFDILRVILKNRFLNCRKQSSQETAYTQGEDINEIKSRIYEQHDADRRIIEYLKTEIEKRDAQLLSKDNLLSERADYLRLKDRYIRTLALLLGVSILAIMCFLIADIVNPSLGFFWIEQMAALVG